MFFASGVPSGTASLSISASRLLTGSTQPVSCLCIKAQLVQAFGSGLEEPAIAHLNSSTSVSPDIAFCLRCEVLYSRPLIPVIAFWCTRTADVAAISAGQQWYRLVALGYIQQQVWHKHRRTATSLPQSVA